jgi:single-stranded-DNA-specific exonuclease
VTDSPIGTRADSTPSSRSTARIPDQRWQIAPAQTEQAALLGQSNELSPLLGQVLINRGITTVEETHVFLEPEQQVLPSPLEEFPDLPIALELLLQAIAAHHPIAICGDYDADGMTSTALLIRALRFLGAEVDYAIPSRMQEGYGINRRIVEDFYADGVKLILTVDNGIAAHDPIARARELGLTVIVTDHHDLPPTLPDANAILNPKLIDEASPYYGVAGVGVAYILAICLAQCLKRTQDLTVPLLELFTLGTIADLAPLTGVNRRWVKRGLKLLPKSRNPGVQALIQVAGLSNEKALKPEAIGFRLGPRINAIGRVSDPQIVIELLTTDDEGRALELAMQCEQVNQLRQKLCELIEAEAIAWCETSQMDLLNDRVLVVVQPGWHHGVIGIVASRLVERYGVPVFIGTYEEEDESHIRGSARSIPEFNIFEALEFSKDLLARHGGHRAAGGFSLKAENLDQLRSRLSLYANSQLLPEHLKPLVKIDVQATLKDLTFDLYQQIDRLHPCGIENADPVFWTERVRLLDQKAIGKNQAHLKLMVVDGQNNALGMKAIAWRWGEYCPLPEWVDVAYKLRLNEWNGTQSVELELIGVRPTNGLPTPTRMNARINGGSVQAQAYSPELNLFSAETKSGVLNQTGAPNQTGAIATSLPKKHPTPSVQLEPTEVASTTTNITEALLPESPVAELRSSKAELASAELASAELASAEPLPTAPQIAAEFSHQSQDYTCKLTAFPLHKTQTFTLEIHATTDPQCDFQRDANQPYDFTLIRAAIAALDPSFDLPANLSTDPSTPSKTPARQTATKQRKSTAKILTIQAATIQTQLGDRLWYCLHPDSQQDLLKFATQFETIAPTLSSKSSRTSARSNARLNSDTLISAKSNQTQLPFTDPASDPQTTLQIDYAPLALHLCTVIVREVLRPFFQELARFTQTNGVQELGGISLPSDHPDSDRFDVNQPLPLLSPLLSDRWQTFQPSLLQSATKPKKNLYRDASAELTERDRQLLQSCLHQWQHPVSQWLATCPVDAASAIAQINDLHQRVCHTEQHLYNWQLELLMAIVVGDATSAGILRDVFN